MSKPTKPKKGARPQGPNLNELLKPYKKLIFGLIALSLAANAVTLWLPRLLANGIDDFMAGGSLNAVLWRFGIASVVIFAFTYGQQIVQIYASERVARDVRNKLSAKMATLTYAEVQKLTPATLLTNLTSDVDAIKNYVAQAVAMQVSSMFLIAGGSVLLLMVNWKLALVVLSALPIIGLTFGVILGRVRKLFMQAREVVDWLNKVINESILGAALIRVLNSQKSEHAKFDEANTKATNVGYGILNNFAAMIPIIGLAINLATLGILLLGGKFIIDGSMTFGEYAAFGSYLTILVFPIFILGFVGNLVAQATASYARIKAVLTMPEPRDDGTVVEPLRGTLALENVTLKYGEKFALKNVSLQVAAGSKTAIIGPTAAGKTQLLNLLVGLIQPTEGSVKYDGRPLTDYKQENLYKQVGLVFQDSIVFNMTLRENIAFNTDVREEDLQRALETAELSDFVGTLPDGLNTVVSERGQSLSGGQKQRVMLARALAINPRVLLLDDFTARVDSATEAKILANVARNYPSLTLVSVTQKVASVESYDQIVVLMEGEVIARGTHAELMKSSPEYLQIYHSQQSTETL